MEILFSEAIAIAEGIGSKKFDYTFPPQTRTGDIETGYSKLSSFENNITSLTMMS